MIKPRALLLSLLMAGLAGAQSPQMPDYLKRDAGLSAGLTKALDVKTRERIALAVAQANGCDYCLSAHTYLGLNLARISPEGQLEPTPQGVIHPGGFTLWVAIADVAHYVTPNSPLDREARKRGNSTYFPDRVVPMLPERISNDLCSLVPGEPRGALAVRLVIGADGHKRSHSFHRVLMRSAAI